MSLQIVHGATRRWCAKRATASFVSAFKSFAALGFCPP
jgi:hypothetical protein